MIFAHCSQFHNCIPYTDKKSFTFNTQSHVATFFSQIPLFCRNFRMSDILAEPLFDWFINLLRRSTFSYQEENLIITAIQSVTIQTYFIDENALRKKSIFASIQSTTLPRIILHSFYSPFAITTSGFYFPN